MAINGKINGLKAWYGKCVAVLLVLLCLNTPVLAASLTDEEAGKTFYHMLQRKLPLIQDPVALDYMNHLGFRLVAYSGDPSQHFYFFMVRANDINAFAGPYGYIGVNSGLAIQTQSESELASVLAHEISHVTQRHLYRGQAQMSQLTLPALAAMAAGIATANPAIAAGSITAVTGGAAQYGINMTRGYEREADSMGIQTLARAGFDPNAMAKFFERMQEESRYDSAPSPLLQTHPVTQERIAEAENRADKYPSKTYISSPLYNLVKARLIVTTARDQAHLLNHAKKALHNNQHPYYQYQYALALAANKQYDEAVKLLQTLSEQYPTQVVYPYTQAEILIAHQKLEPAIAILSKLYTYNSHYYPLVMLYAGALVDHKQGKEAIAILDKYQSDYQEDINYWALFSKAEAQIDNLIYAYLYRSKAYFLMNDKKNAVLQLHMAMKQDDNTPYTKKLIAAELKKYS